MSVLERFGWKGVRYKSKGGNQSVTKAFNFEIKLAYLHPDYTIEIASEPVTTRENLLILGKFAPRQASLPEFLMRWDEKDQHLNVDMKPEQKGWNQEINGFKGHTTHKKSGHHEKVYSLEIMTPSFRVVDCIISFNLAYDVASSVKIGVKAEAKTNYKPHN
jgi:hypothetical protein